MHGDNLLVSIKQTSDEGAELIGESQGGWARRGPERGGPTAAFPAPGHDLSALRFDRMEGPELAYLVAFW
jgi:hypothetical protein